MPKSTNAEKGKRVNKVFELLLNGYSRAQILQYAAEKSEWDIAERTVDDYIAEATERIDAAGVFVREHEFGMALLRYHMLFQACMRVQDYGRAIAAQRELTVLLGLNAPKTVRIEGVDMTLLAKLADMLATVGLSTSDVFQDMMNEIAASKNAHVETTGTPGTAQGNDTR